jgi:hypothetical protein
MLLLQLGQMALELVEELAVASGRAVVYCSMSM